MDELFFENSTLESSLPKTNQMKIGIIGSGIAGLSAGWFLSRRGHQVTMIERLDRIGMSAHAIQLEVDGRSIHGDVPSRMFNTAQWPNLSKLYDEIGVEVEPVDSSQSFSGDDRRSFLQLKLPYRFSNPTILFKANVRRVLGDMRRLKIDGEADLQKGIDPSITLNEYLSKNEFSPDFIKQFFYPILSSTVCTCSYQSLDQYPAEMILEAVRKISVDQPLMKTKYGTSDVVNRLTKVIATKRFSASVENIRVGNHSERDELNPNQVHVQFVGGESEAFDHMIVATQANSAAKFLGPEFENELSVLANIQYENVPVIVHRDDSFMPIEKKKWSTFNMISNDSAAMCTVHMNRFHPNWKFESPIFQTINPIEEPKRDVILGQSFLQRPVVNTGTVATLDELDRIQKQPDRRVWFCGSFAFKGIPLLETGVQSAAEICERIHAADAKKAIA